MTTFKFPVGYHNLHKTKIIDFQLNRWYSLGYVRLEDMEEAAARIIENFARWLFEHPTLMRILSDWKMKMRPQEKWGIDNLKYITKTKTALDAGLALAQFNEENLKSGLVTQDVLILTGAKDHFIPLKMHYMQVAALTQAKSITERIFTEKDQGQNHCQIGNIGLALRVMEDWIATKSEEPLSEA